MCYYQFTEFYATQLYSTQFEMTYPARPELAKFLDATFFHCCCMRSMPLCQSMIARIAAIIRDHISARIHVACGT